MPIIAGSSGAWFLMFLGRVIPQFFQFEPLVFPGEVLFMFSVAGLVFGYYLGASLKKTAASFVFASAGFAWLILSSLVYLPPFFYGGLGMTEATLALLIPGVFGITLTVSDILEPTSQAQRIFEQFSSRVSWYLFWIHVGVMYEYPMFLKLLSEPVSAFGPNTVYFVLLTFAWIVMLYAISVVTGVLERYL